MSNRYRGYIIGTFRYNLQRTLFGDSNIKCINCGADIFDDSTCMCDSCKQLVVPVEGKTCLRCGSVLPTEEYYCDNCNYSQRYFDKAYSMFVYEGIIPKLMYKVKYGGVASICESLANYLVYLATIHKLQYDIVCAVPMTKIATNKRGYNQAQLLAKYFCDILEKKIFCNCLSKKVETNQQESLDRATRRTNVLNAFACDNSVKGKSVLLIDDVMTTGSTLNECSKVLKKAGAVRVVCLTVASGRIRITLEDNNVSI